MFPQAEKLTSLEVPNVFAARFSSDSQHVVTFSFDGVRRVWDVSTGAQLANLKLPGLELFPRCVFFLMAEE